MHTKYSQDSSLDMVWMCYILCYRVHRATIRQFSLSAMKPMVLSSVLGHTLRWVRLCQYNFFKKRLLFLHFWLKLMHIKIFVNLTMHAKNMYKSHHILNIQLHPYVSLQRYTITPWWMESLISLDFMLWVHKNTVKNRLFACVL